MSFSPLKSSIIWKSDFWECSVIWYIFWEKFRINTRFASVALCITSSIAASLSFASWISLACTSLSLAPSAIARRSFCSSTWISLIASPTYSISSRIWAITACVDKLFKDCVRLGVKAMSSSLTCLTNPSASRIVGSISPCLSMVNR